MKRAEIKNISSEVMSALLAHPWPGNIRELYNLIERAIVLCRGRTITEIHLPQPAAPGGATPALLALTLDEWLREQEKNYLEQQLESLGGNVSLTAKICGVGL